MHSILTKKKIIITGTIVAGSCGLLIGLGTHNLFTRAESSISNTCPSNMHPEFIYISEESDHNLSRQITTSLSSKLFLFTKSSNKSVRHLAVQALSELKNLEKFQCMKIAQACDVRTAIGFSRSPNAPSCLFLPPPFRDLKQGNLLLELQLVLKALPYSDVDECLHLFKQKAINFGFKVIDNHDSWYSDNEEPSIHFYTEKRNIKSFIMLCLQTFLGYSSVKSHKYIMIQNGILKLLHKILISYSNELEFQSLIAQILSNLSMEEEFINHIYATGWLGVLSSWIKSPHLEISLPASKALANLDRDDIQHVLFDNGIYILHPQYREKKNLGIDIVFIHGLLGGAFYTWRQNDSKKFFLKNHPLSAENDIDKIFSSQENYTFCWPKDWLAVDFPDVRIIAVDYNTSITKWKTYCPHEKSNNILNTRADELLNKLLLAGIGERPIIWITHSMGGLIVKQMLVDALSSTNPSFKLVADNTAGVVFYSVPHKGSEIANLMHSAPLIFQPAFDVNFLQKGSPILLNLNEKFKQLCIKNNISILSFGETKKSNLGFKWTSIMVSLESSYPNIGEFYELPADHLSTCKPETQDSKSYKELVKFIHNIVIQSSAKKFS